MTLQKPRDEVADLAEVQVSHAVQRCVRYAFKRADGTPEKQAPGNKSLQSELAVRYKELAGHVGSQIVRSPRSVSCNFCAVRYVYVEKEITVKRIEAESNMRTT